LPNSSMEVTLAKGSENTPMQILFCALLLMIGLAEAHTSPPKAHEYIRVVQENGVWWFQDGSGRKFFSLGVNCIGGCFGHAEQTPIEPARKERIISLLKDWGFNTAAAGTETIHSHDRWRPFRMATRAGHQAGPRPLLIGQATD